MGTSNNRGLRRLVDALGFSAAGFAAAWRGEEAFRQEVLLGLVLLPASLWLGRSVVERGFLIGAWLLVMTVEMLNSAIEATVDRIGSERHPLAGRAKDMGSAAVLLSLLLAALAWGTVAWERFVG